MKKLLLRVGIAIVAAVLSWVSLRVLVLDYFRQGGGAMKPAVQPGDIVFGNRLVRYAPERIRRGDIILYRQPFEGREEVFIMRVIGLPGDFVEINENAVVVNGEKLPRAPIRQEGDHSVWREQIANVSYEIYLTADKTFPQKLENVKVPETCFYVLGDNRPRARDSRHTGFIPFGRLVAKKL